MGRNVTLFSDIGAYDKWQDVMKTFLSICVISISNLLICNASREAKKEGFDLADYLRK